MGVHRRRRCLARRHRRRSPSRSPPSIRASPCLPTNAPVAVGRPQHRDRRRPGVRWSASSTTAIFSLPARCAAGSMRSWPAGRRRRLVLRLGPDRRGRRDSSSVAAPRPVAGRQDVAFADLAAGAAFLSSSPLVRVAALEAVGGFDEGSELLTISTYGCEWHGPDSGSCTPARSGSAVGCLSGATVTASLAEPGESAPPSGARRQ